MNNVKSIIYDVDGTLINSEPTHVAAWDLALRENGSKMDDLSIQLKSTMAGKKPIIIAQMMAAELNLTISANTLLEQKSDVFMSLSRDIELMPGATNSLKRFKTEGYRLGIGTSLDSEYINLLLDRFHISELFDSKITGDIIKKGKPDPETYLTVAKELRLNPSECLVLEDATSGVQSAKLAGMWCIAVENRNAVRQDFAMADRIVDSLDEVSLELIRSLRSFSSYSH